MFNSRLRFNWLLSLCPSCETDSMTNNTNNSEPLCTGSPAWSCLEKIHRSNGIQTACFHGFNVLCRAKYVADSGLFPYISLWPAILLNSHVASQSDYSLLKGVNLKVKFHGNKWQPTVSRSLKYEMVRAGRSVEELPWKDGESEAGLAVEVGAGQIKGPGDGCWTWRAARMPGELLHNRCLYAVRRNTEPGRSLTAGLTRLWCRAWSLKVEAESLHVKMYLGKQRGRFFSPLFYFPSEPCKCNVVTGGIK